MKKLVNGTKIGVVLVGFALISVACVSRSEAATFQGLGDLPGGGFSSHARGVSADGSVIVGESNSASGYEAFRWTTGGGMVGLGDLPDGSFYSRAYSVSTDGSVVVGHGTSASGGEAYRWKAGGGMVGLGDLPGGSFYSNAYGVSADGSVVAGWGYSAQGREAFRWTSSDGMVGLGDLASGIFDSYALSVSADGSVIVGLGNSASGYEAFRWVDLNGNGLVDPDEKLDNHPEFGLGDLPGGDFDSRAYGASGDGSVVVGFGTSASGREAYIWDAANGVRNLRDVLVNDYGLDLTGWTLTGASGVSADGFTIVGYGTNPDGYDEAWIATIPEPGTLVLVAIGALGIVFGRRKKG